MNLTDRPVTGNARFLTIRCKDCGNEQQAFGRPATVVKCTVCGATLIKPTGGKGLVQGTFVGVIE